MSNIKRIDPARERHLRNGKGMLEAVCGSIEALDLRVEGYAVVAWDSRGSACGYVKSGGPISLDLVPYFVHSKLSQN